MTVGLDEPGTTCAFHVHDCSDMIASHGGFDLHHRWPQFMGGAAHQPDELTLCPNHHRRQHALVRYLVECQQRDVPTSTRITRRFASIERETALYALTSWNNAGKPHIPGWSAPAAR